jgi:hypothetical protein
MSAARGGAGVVREAITQGAASGFDHLPLGQGGLHMHIDKYRARACLESPEIDVRYVRQRSLCYARPIA